LREPLIILLYVSVIDRTTATDLGIYVRVWEIKEIGLKQLIAEELHKVNIKQIQINYKKQVKHFGETLTPNLLPNAEQTETIYTDPSISLSKNIIINGKALYKKGIWINPLTIVRPNENMLFF
jgi:hypothetical protein